MSKWISEAYIKMLMQTDRLLQGNCEYKLWEQEVEKIVDAMPSIDIVFCKECRHRINDDDFQEGHICLKRRANGGKYCKDNDFCSYGERAGE